MTKPYRILMIVCAIVMAAIATLFWSTLLGSASATDNTLYVAPPPAGNDGNPCSSSQPCATLQHVVDVASSDDTILVATGIYTGVQAHDDMTQVLYISKTVLIQGGYRADFAAWDPLVFPTIIDAEGQGRVVSIVRPDVVTISPTLDSLVVTGGNANGITKTCPSAGGTSQGCGGGIFVYNARVFITNNVISGNVAAVSTGSNSASGGGVCLSYAHGTVISGNLIVGNYASQGARGMGGGMHLDFPHNVRVVNNRVLSNVATTHDSLPGWGGGIAMGGSGSAATVSGNDIVGNRTNGSSGGFGAGIYHWYGSSDMSGNRVTNNHGAHAAYLGGYAGARFDANQVVSNSTNYGIWMTNGAGGNPTLANNIVARSGHSATLYVQGFSGGLLTVTLLHNTLVGAGTGDGVYVGSYAMLTLTDNIVAGHVWGITNTAPANSSVLVNYTLFWDNEQHGIVGAKVIYADPVFIDPGGGDYHLGPGSAAIDVAIDVGEQYDVDGDQRPIGPAPDIGADEAYRWFFLPLILRSSPGAG